MLPAPLLLPQSGGCGRLAKALPETSANARVRQQKENGRASGRDSGFRNCHMWLNGQKPSTTTGPTPRTRRCERSGRSPECRRPSLFLLHHQKAHSLFPLQEKENGGVAPRRSRKPPGFSGTPPALRDGAQNKGGGIRRPLFSGYIFSGASTPMSFRPFFSTIRAQSASFRRAAVTWGSSPLMRQAV